MKSKKEIDALKIEFRNLSGKLKELTREELKEVTGGVPIINPNGGCIVYRQSGGNFDVCPLDFATRKNVASIWHCNICSKNPDR